MLVDLVDIGDMVDFVDAVREGVILLAERGGDLKMRVATSAQIAELDRRATKDHGISVAQLMDAAGRRVAQAAEIMLREHGGRRVVVMAGRGSNGGDGLVAARYLAAGAEVAALFLAPREEFGGESAQALAAASEAGVSFLAGDAARHEDAIGRADLIIDALFGTGFRGTARGDAVGLIEAANRSGKPILAVDVPAWLQDDIGTWDGPCVRASVTVTMGLPKVGVVLFPGAEMAGALYVGDIGYPQALMDDPSITTWLVTSAKVRELLPRRRPDTHKGTYGHVLILAGSVGYTGAAVLSTFGALRSGAGLVTVAVPQSVYPIVASKVTEGIAMPLADDGSALSPSAMARVDELLASCDVVAAGPGLSPAPGVARVVEELLGRDKPLVLDADGLNVLAGRADRLAKARPPVVITPPPGELGRLLKQPTPKIVEDRLGAARAAAARFRCVVVLKSAHTVVAKPDGEAAIVRTGNPGMASGGMGDVLTGALAALIGQGMAPFDAAVAAAYLHGLAGDLGAQEIGQVGLLASDVADRLPHAIRRVQAGLQVDPIHELLD